MDNNPLDDLLTPDQMDALDRLMGRALVDPGFRTRLLNKDDYVFLTENRLSQSTWHWLKSLPAQSLPQLCQAVISAMTPENVIVKSAKGASMTAKILFAEDSSIMPTMLAALLKPLGYSIQTAESGLTALSALTSTNVDLLIVDLTQSDMDSYELCKQVRCNPITAHLPIVMLLGPHEEDGETKGVEAGADRIITKPIFLDQLIQLLGELLQPVAN